MAHWPLSRGAQYYSSVPNYSGDDQATFLVEIGGYKVTVKYFFKVMTDVPGSGDEGSPEMDKRFCPNGPMWRISFDNSDPTAPVYTFTSPTQLTSALAGAVQANLTFADLSGDAVGHISEELKPGVRHSVRPPNRTAAGASKLPNI